MMPQDIVTGLSAAAAGLLAFLPLYQKWRELRRDQDAADIAAGIAAGAPRTPGDPAGGRGAPLRAASRSWEAWAGLLLGLVIVAGLIGQAIRAERFLAEYVDQRRQIADAIERQKDLRAAIARIEARMGR